MGAGGKETGRVSVKVVPDMDGFGREVKAYLNKLEKELELNVKVNVDQKAIKRAVSGVTSAFGKNDAFNLDGLFDGILDAKSASATERFIERTVVRAVRLSGAIKNARTALKGMATSTKDVAKSVLNIRQHWLGLGPVFRGLSRGVTRIRADGLYTTVIRSSDAVVDLTRNVRRATTTVGRFSALASAKPITLMVSGLTKLAKIAASATVGFFQLGRTILLTIGVIGSAAPLVGFVSGLLAGLPSLAFAGGAAIAAIALGFDGIKKAASSLAPAVDKLKKSLSATFEKGLTPVFKQLATVFPVLDKGLNQVATGLIGLAAGFTEVVTSAAGLQQIKETLANTGAFFTNIKPFVKDFTSAFLTLAAEGSKSFDILAGTLNKFASDFNAMINRVAGDGTLRQAFVGLGQITDSMLSLFTKLFEAGLRVLPQVAGPFSQMVTQIGDALVAIMPSLGIISNFMSVFLGAAFEGLGRVIKALEPGLQALANVLGTLVVGAVQILTPILVALAGIVSKLFAAIEKALAPILEPLIKFFVALAEIISGFLIQAFEALQPLIDEVLNLFVEIFVALEPLLPELTKLAEEIFAALLEVLRDVVPVLVDLAKVVFPILVDIIKKAVPIVIGLVRAFVSFYEKVQEIWRFLVEHLGPVFEALGRIVEIVFTNIGETIGTALELIRQVFVGFKQFFTGDWDGLWETIKGAASTALTFVADELTKTGENIVGAIKELPQKAKDALGDVANVLVDAGKALVGGFIDGIERRTQDVVDHVEGMLQAIRLMLPFSPAKKGPFSGKGYTLYSGMALMQGFADGIAAGTPAAVNAMDGALSQLHATGSFESSVTANSSGTLFDGIVTALSGWTVEFDPNGVARMVNTANTKKARRG